MENKTPFIPTAMRCTQEQFDAIKPKLIERGCEIIGAYGFSGHSPYLEAWIYQNEKHITITATSKNGVEHGSKIYEEWNEEIFLRNLGGEEAEACERKINIEFTGPEAEAMMSTIKALNTIIDTQKLSIATNFEIIAIKDEIIERLQSRISELEQTGMEPIKTNFFQSFINRIKQSYAKK